MIHEKVAENYLYAARDYLIKGIGYWNISLIIENLYSYKNSLVLKDKADEIILLEVKSLSDADWVLQRISQRQRQRLKNALKYFQNHFCDEVRLHLAFVSSDGEIEIFEDFLA